MKSLICAVFAALSLLFTAGCASGRIQDKSYLRAVCITGGSEKELTMAFFSEEGVLTVSGDCTDSAAKQGEIINGRKVFTGYTELILTDGRDSRELLEHMLTDWQVSSSCMVVYSSCGKQLLEEKGAERLTGTVRQAVEQGTAPKSDIITVLGGLCSGSCAETAELRADGTAGSSVIY